MFRRLARAISLGGLLALCGCQAPREKSAFEQGNFPRELPVVRTRQRVILDGRLSEWDRCRFIPLSFPPDSADPNQVRAVLMWDYDYLYFAFSVRDRFLVAAPHPRPDERGANPEDWAEKWLTNPRGERTEYVENPRFFLDDHVALFFDPENHGTDQWLPDDALFRLNLRGRVQDERGAPSGQPRDRFFRGQGKIEFKVLLDGTLNDNSDDDVGYVIEGRIPWEELGIENPRAGLLMRANLLIADRDHTGPVELKDYRFVDTMGRFLRQELPERCPQHFSRLRLEGDAPPEEKPNTIPGGPDGS